MAEQRQFHRVNFTAKSSLNDNDVHYTGHLENISLNGALVSLNDGIIVLQGDEYLLSIYLKDDEHPIRVKVEVVHSFLTMLGLKFITTDSSTRQRLYELLEKISSEPDKLKTEMERIQGHLARFLRT
jgi:hypothetical protein